MAYAFNYVFSDPIAALGGIVALFGACLFMFDKLNNQTTERKKAHTRLFVIFGMGTSTIFAVYVRVANDDHQRAFVPVVLMGVHWAVVILADWVSLALYKSGYHPGGFFDYTWDRIKALAVYVWDRGRRWLALMLAGIAVLACLSVTMPPGLQLATPLPSSTPTATPILYTPTPTGLPTVTPFYVEVTAATPASPTPSPAIYEIGTPLGATFPPPGVIKIEAGSFTPWGRVDVYDCPALTCNVISAISAYQPKATQGLVSDADGAIWVCLSVTVDDGPGGAQGCPKATIYIDASGQKHGTYGG